LGQNASTTDEQAKTQQTYQSDKSQMAKTKPQFFHAKMREAMIDASIFPTA
jgi:hypothetical protein